MRTVSSGILKPLASRDFALLWAGQGVSLIGDGIFTVTLAWQTLALTSSPTALAAVLFARSVPMVLLLIVGGAITDRISRRTLLIASDLARGVAVGIIAVLVAADTIALWHLIVLGAVFGTVNAFFFPAYTAIVPEVLPQEHLAAGNALSTTSRLVGAHFAGPVLGGLLIASVGTGLAFAADALSFGVALAAALLMRPLPTRLSPKRRMTDEVREGFAFTRAQPWLWVTLLTAAVGNMSFAAFGLLMPVVVKETLAGSAADLGLVSAAVGFGGILAALAVGQAGVPRRRIAFMYGTWAAGGVGLAGLGLAPSIAVAAIAAGVEGFLLEYGGVIWITLMQELVPRQMLGRVSAFDWLLSIGLTPAAYAIAGPLAAAIGAGPVLVGGGLLAVAANALGVTRRGVLDPDRQRL